MPTKLGAWRPLPRRVALPTSKLIINGLVGGFFQVALYALALLVPAGLLPGGTWHWPRALVFLGVYGAMLEGSVILLALRAPESLAARLTGPRSKDQPIADRRATAFLVLATLGWFAFVPVDNFVLQLLPSPPVGVSLGGGVVAFAGFVIILTAIYQNSFAIPIVRDQTDRAQRLVDTGLYSLVRHPMYLGILIFHAGLALWLQSYASLLTLTVIVAALLTRIVVEERTLQQTLPDYRPYMTRVRQRLIPLVW